MSDQLPMFDHTSLPDSGNAIFSPESASGLTRSDSPVCRTMNQSGQDPVRVNRSARRANAKARRTYAICGRLGFDSSQCETLSEYLASRLVPVADSLGSTLFDLTWKRRITKQGLSICAVRASALPTSDSGCTSWVSPQAKDFRCGAERYLSGKHAVSINDQAMLAAWGTPTKRDYFSPHSEERIALMRARGHGMQDLNDMASLAVRLMDTGETPIGSGVGTKSTGQLNPELSRWLMGLPRVFCECAVTAMESLRRSRRRSSKQQCRSEVTT